MTTTKERAFETVECQDRADWLECRRHGLGGSDAAAIMGLSPWRTPLQLYADKIGVTEDTAPTEWQEWGLKLEPLIASKYEAETGRTLKDPGDFTIYRNAELGFLQCTPDRDVFLVDYEKDPMAKALLESLATTQAGILEIKTAAGWKGRDWEDEPPLYYQVQLQHNLMTTGRKWGSFAVLFGGQSFGWLDVERNDSFCEVLREKELEFWRLVESRTPPPAGAPDSKILQELYPVDSGESVALPGEAITKADRLEELKAEIKALDKEKREIENWIKQEIGEATYGIAPDGSRWKYKLESRKGYEVAPKEFRVLRRLKS